MTSMFRRTSVLAVLAALMTITADAAMIRGRTGETYEVDTRVADLVSKAAAAGTGKDYRKAIPYLTAALETKPEPVVAAAVYDIRGWLYLEIEDHTRALGDANEALRLNPRLAGAHQTRGRVYRYRRENEKAIGEFNKALELHPAFTYIYVNRAAAYLDAGNYERAMQDLDVAIRRDPKLADAYGNRGIVYYYRGQYNKALREYNKAISLNPAAVDGYCNRSMIFNKTGQWALALRDDNEAIRRDPANTEGYYRRGETYEAKGDYKQALADFQKARQLRPKDQGALNGIAWLKATCPDQAYRNGDEAVRTALELCQLSGWKEGDYLDTLAAAYAEQGDFEKAVQQQKRALQLDTGVTGRRDGKQSRLQRYEEHKPFRQPVPHGSG